MHQRRKKEEPSYRKFKKNLKKKENELKRQLGKKKILREITQLREKIDMEITNETYWNLKKIQQKSFEFANKLGRLLANLVKKRKERK